VAAILLLAAVVIAGESFLGYSAKTYWMLALLGLVPQLIGHTSLNLAVRRLPATLVSVAILGEPVGATLLGWGLLGEVPGAKEIAGGLIIICGILMVVGSGGREALEQV
jgi:drug/metabolite transporter (DMT)-like permease